MYNVAQEQVLNVVHITVVDFEFLFYNISTTLHHITLHCITYKVMKWKHQVFIKEN